MSERIFLTTAEAANRLGLAKKTLERWRWSGDGPPFTKLGRATRYDIRLLDEWAAQRVRQSTSDGSSRPDGARRSEAKNRLTPQTGIEGDG